GDRGGRDRRLGQEFGVAVPPVAGDDQGQAQRTSLGHGTSPLPRREMFCGGTARAPPPGTFLPPERPSPRSPAGRGFRPRGMSPPASTHPRPTRAARTVPQEVGHAPGSIRRTPPPTRQL